MARLALVVGAVAIALGWSSEASAYCRTTLCGPEGDPGQACVPAMADDCGTPLFWRSSCVGYAIQQDASPQVDLTTLEMLMQQAFDTWSSADCGDGLGPSIAGVYLGTVACNELEYNQRSGNANSVIFRDRRWPYPSRENALALTTVTYNLDTGEIFDTDLEVNGTQQVQLTVGEDQVVYDVLSILTHEAGHMLGLSHSPETQATMRLDYVPGDLALRDLSTDDIAGICAAYPPDRAATCDPTPRRGFRSDCAPPETDEDDGGCHLAPPSDSDEPTRPLFALAVLIGATLRRRRG